MYGHTIDCNHSSSYATAMSRRTYCARAQSTFEQALPRGRRVHILDAGSLGDPGRFLAEQPQPQYPFGSLRNAAPPARPRMTAPVISAFLMMASARRERSAQAGVLACVKSTSRPPQAHHA
jgi:hypothetical protein